MAGSSVCDTGCCEIRLDMVYHAAGPRRDFLQDSSSTTFHPGRGTVTRNTNTQLPQLSTGPAQVVDTYVTGSGHIKDRQTQDRSGAKSGYILPQIHVCSVQTPKWFFDGGLISITARQAQHDSALGSNAGDALLTVYL